VFEVHEAIAATLTKITRRKDFGTDAEKWRKWYGVSGGSVTRPFEVPSEEIKLTDEEVKKLVEDFKLELKNGDSIVRIDAIRQVGRIKHTDIAKAIAKALSDKDPAVRKTAAEALAYQADKGTMKALCKYLPLNKNHPQVQAQIILALGAIGDWRALPAVTKNLMKPGEAEVTKARITALGNIRHQDSIQNLIDFMVRWGRSMKDYAKPIQESLKKLTGKDFGRNRNAWKTWWDRNKKTFRFPRKK
ncbi:MAG: HEAT repeat domain-containing protein, partial [Planctomycetota bacterium]|jgi:HEAT repeat protein